ncbi:Uu.00g019320.m01.CDS01 [Anthostomella pinea]|uniref:Uu.00g019320.m01.CDS01 n=1 Tax=Anthostomella pinea TaxID=933095 RepID=A0AAI8W0G7_9PEZI|nr:Uu.00g019320.m01.CDS01 [Anthostomella pinea]
MDMFRLCRSDNMGLRSTAPSIMLRLDKVQECYDFIKWWYTGTDGQYDWADASLPYLNIKDADVFEPCDVFISEFPDLGQGVALVLLKIKLLMDLQSLQEASRSVGDNVPQEILDMIREKAVGPAVSSRPEIMEQPDQSQNIAAMRKQKSNIHFWPALLNPASHLVARPEYYSRGQESEMQVTLKYSYASWAETPGAIDIIRTLSKA